MPTAEKIETNPVQPSGRKRITKQAGTESVPASTAGGISVASQLVRANRWRENYNPLRGLTITTVATLLEQGERGEYAELQWLFRFIEKRDPILRTLIKRRRAALAKLDWEIKTVAELPPGATEEQAEAQAQALREAYDFVDNLREAIGFLATAEFRGFAHLQKHYADGAVRHLECLPQWNWVRNGMFGPWLYNEGANNFSAVSLVGDEDAIIDPQDFIIREEEAPIDEIAAVIFVRKNLSQKDWDAFVEIFGIPGCVVIGPANVPKGREDDYRDAAEDVAEGGNGFLPNGSTVEWPSDVRSQGNPFKEHKDDLDQQLVIAGTGGKLTMLNEATGIGSGNASAHQQAFDDLAIEEASVISELFQRHFDADVIARQFPGEPVLAYFELCAKDKDDVNDVADRAVKFSQAGFQADAEQLSEMTGWRLEKKEPLQLPPAAGQGQPQDPEDGMDQDPEDDDDGPMSNRSSDRVMSLVQAFADDLAPVRARLERILGIQNEDILRNKLQEFRDELPQLLKDINADPKSAAVFEQAMQAAFLKGIKS